MGAVEKYYSVAECAFLLSCDKKTIVRALPDIGKEPRDVINLGGEGKGADYRIAASALNRWIHARRVFSELDEPGIAARSEGELRRKSHV